MQNFRNELLDLKNRFQNTWNGLIHDVRILGNASDKNGYKLPLLSILDDAHSIRTQMIDTGVFINGVSKLETELDESDTLEKILSQFDNILLDIDSVNQVTSTSNFKLINCCDKQVKIFITDEEFEDNKNTILDEIKESVLDNYDCGEVLSYQWCILITRPVIINGLTYSIDNDLISETISRILNEVNFDIDEFLRICKMNFYICELEIESYENQTPKSKTILVRDDGLIDKSAYSVPILTNNEEIATLVKLTYSLWWAISSEDINNVKSLIKEISPDLTVDSFKFDGAFIDDWHSLFSILLKIKNIAFHTTEAAIFDNKDY